MDFVDPYVDEETGELRNLLGATSAGELRDIEPEIVFANELELESAGIPRTNDLVEVCAIHSHLFHNVYDWAGEIRTVDIKKNEDAAEFFLPHSRIQQASAFVFSELAAERGLGEQPFDTFVKRLSYFYDQLNYIHPFREGNGRTQRIFWTRVTNDAGYGIDWDEVEDEENDHASRLAAEELDLGALESMFIRIVRPK